MLHLIILTHQKHGLTKVGKSHISKITLHNNYNFPLTGYYALSQFRKLEGFINDLQAGLSVKSKRTVEQKGMLIPCLHSIVKREIGCIIHGHAAAK